MNTIEKTFDADNIPRNRKWGNLNISEGKYLEVFRSSPVCIAIVSLPEIRYIEINDCFLDTLGWNRKEILGQAESELKLIIDAQFFQETLQHIVGSGQKYNFETQFRKKSGDVFTALVSSGLIEINGQDCVILTFMDISERRQTGSIVKKTGPSFKEFIDLAPDAFFQGDDDGNFILVNDKALELTAYSREELLKMNIKDLFSKDVLINNPLRFDLLEKGEILTSERKIVTKTGKCILVEMNSRKLPSGTYQSIIRDIDIQRRAEDALKESERKFAVVFQLSPVLMAISTIKDGRFLDVNNAFLKTLGFTREEAIGKTSKDLNIWVNSDDRGRSIKELSKNGHLDSFEIQVKGKNGIIHTGIFCGEAILVGDMACLLTVMTDITERKQAEEELKYSQQRFRSIVEASPMGMHLYELTNDGNLVFCGSNIAADRILGLDHSIFLGKTIEEAFPGLINTGVPESYKEVASHGTQWHNEQINYNEGTISGAFEVVAFQTGTGRMAALFNNITARKKAEEALMLSEERFKILSSIASEGIMVHKDGVILEANLAFAKLIGYQAPEELIGKKGFETVMFTTGSQKTVMDHLGSNSDETYDIEIVNLKGKVIPVETKGINIIYKEHKARLIYMRDITERKRSELNLQEKKEEYESLYQKLLLTNEELLVAKEKAEESDRLKTAFLQNMSHEIRTPMNAIMGFSDLLPDQFNDKSKLEQYSKIIHQRCSDLLDLINDLLDIAKIESGQLPINMEECDLNELFGELTTFFKEYQARIGKNQIRFSLQALCNEPENLIATDKLKLKQIFINLISNAFKFTKTGIINGGCKLDKNNNLIFFVSDTGIGIPPDKQDFVFERFAQLHNGAIKNAGGTGLGLSIVKGLVGLLGGEISLVSEPGKGSTFSFRIPYMPVKQVSHSDLSPKTLSNQQFQNETLLIVEDDFYNAEYLKEILGSTGFNIILVEHGKEAVQISLAYPIDIILMDIRLPDMDGYEATQQIRQHKPDIIIIAQTAYASHEERQKALDAGCNDYLSKPTKRDLLLSMINNYMAKR
jgi:PAS domain S-box-containing protein